ncbi:glycosyltransferase [Mesohalobacter halotolerans]|uniref:Glycosyltransferase family 4 protein n=1 Tax=Mesohalobacter halotolerans TaxID=1883405 RepID=A0A4U5TT45_9FLAO|nr:glycosyltransferase [Mesohalobacter halotolerans]TKS57366.1 glycosyltransferase family 4 protein [Mesohalobacter halotolerans]
MKLKQILIISMQYPEPKSTAAGSRMLQIISLLKSYRYEVHFASTQPKSEYSVDLSSYGLDTSLIKINDGYFDTFIKRLKPDAVIFDRFMTEEQFGWRIDEHCPKALKILDTEDLHFLREWRERQVNSDGHINLPKRLNDIALRELAAIYRCDWTLMISKVEIEILTKTYGISKHVLFYLPFVYKTKDLLDDKTPPYEERSHFVSIGNFKHKPNLDMVKHTYKNIWPKIRQRLPKAEWHIYGAYCPESVKQFHNSKKGVIVRGRADEVLSALENYRIMLAPLRFGAGLKGKCMDSMRAGTPSMTTKIGAEGIASPQNWPGFVEDQPENFTQKSIELYANEDLWKEKQQKGFDILHKEFDIKSFKDDFKTKITGSFQDLESYRHRNIVGQLLKHHHQRSTKFMSLWIEAKNTLT